MDKTNSNYIMNKIKDDPEFHGQNSILHIPVGVQLAVVLYRLRSYGDGGAIRKIASLFGIGDGETIERIQQNI